MARAQVIRTLTPVTNSNQTGLTPGHEETAETVARSLLAEYREAPAGGSEQLIPLKAPQAAERVEAAYRSGRPWNPHFSYAPSPRTGDGNIRLEAIAERAEHYADYFDEWTLASFARFCRKQLTWAQAVSTHEAEALTFQSEQAHGTVTAQEVSFALDILGQERSGDVDPREQGRQLTAAEVVHALNSLLDRCGSPSYRAEVAHMSARMSVSAQHRRVRINAESTFTVQELRRLAVHEVGCHVARGVRGEAQKKPLLALGIGEQHLRTEEGLAAWLEHSCGVLSQGDTRKYALRVLAVQAAKERGFYDVYSMLREYLDAEKAYAMTLRVKRGLRDTAQPGGYLKDHVYLGGWLNVQTAEQANPDTLRALGVGKVSLEMTEQVRKDLERGQLRHGGNLQETAHLILEHVDHLMG